MITSLPALRFKASHLAAGTVLLLAAASPAFARFTPVVCQTSMSQTDEIAEGKQYAAQVYGQEPVLPDSDPVTRYVQQLGAKLVAASPATPGLTSPWQYTFHVIASDEVNAFALPGGEIFINLGTVQAADNEAQLAGVMAHEISHVVMRHATCRMAAQSTKKTVYGLGSMASKMTLGSGGTKGQLGNAAIQKTLGTVESWDFLRMSRDDEKNADLLGVGILYDANEDPRGLPQFFETIQAKYGAGGHQFLSNHPNPGNRKEYTMTEIATLPPAGTTPIASTPAFTKAHAAAQSEKALTASERKSGQWKSSGAYAAGPSN